MTDKPQEPKISPEEDAVNLFIWTSITCMVGGLRAALPHVPMSVLMVKVCSAFGAYIGQAVCVGMIGEVLKVRTACIEAFRDNIKATPIQTPQMANAERPQKLHG